MNETPKTPCQFCNLICSDPTPTKFCWDMLQELAFDADGKPTGLVDQTILDHDTPVEKPKTKTEMGFTWD